MSDKNPSEYRFAQDVALSAPKPGWRLADVSLQFRGEVTWVSLVEGPQNNTIGVVGNRTDFERTYLLRFSLQGSLFEALSGLHTMPSERAVVLNFFAPGREGQSPIGVESAVTVFSSLRASGRPDADSAAVSYLLSGGQSDASEPAREDRVMAAITGYQRGWGYDHIITAGACILWVLSTNPAPGRELTFTVEKDAGVSPGRFSEVTGAVRFRDTIMATS